MPRAPFGLTAIYRPELRVGCLASGDRIPRRPEWIPELGPDARTGCGMLGLGVGCLDRRRMSAWTAVGCLDLCLMSELSSNAWTGC